MASPTIQQPVGRVADLTHPELILLQWHYGIALDAAPAFRTETRRIVERFCQLTDFSGMQIALVRWELLFATYGRHWHNGSERYEWQRWADRDLLDDLNSPGAALRASCRCPAGNGSCEPLPARRQPLPGLVKESPPASA